MRATAIKDYNISVDDRRCTFVKSVSSLILQILNLVEKGPTDTLQQIRYNRYVTDVPQ